MQSSSDNLGRQHGITVLCNESSAFNRNLVALVKQWDRCGNIHFLPYTESSYRKMHQINPQSHNSLLAVDENGVKWSGAEAVPIIFKNLPFGKLAAAIYILPGTMWLTKQLYKTDASQHSSSTH